MLRTSQANLVLTPKIPWKGLGIVLISALFVGATIVLLTTFAPTHAAAHFAPVHVDLGNGITGTVSAMQDGNVCNLSFSHTLQGISGFQRGYTGGCDQKDLLQRFLNDAWYARADRLFDFFRQIAADQGLTFPPGGAPMP